MSQNFDLGLSFYITTRNGQLLRFFMNFCKVPYSTYNKTKTKTYINILRQASLQMGPGKIYRKSQACRWYNKGDINVQKMLLKNVYFLIPGKDP